MRIYKDIFTGEEVLCDQDRPVEELDDIVYTRRGTLITIGGEDFSAAIGANAAAGGGEADEEAEPDAGSAVTDKVQVIDIVHNNRLTKVDYSKDEYKAHIKEYLKKMVEYLKENKPDRVDAFKKGAAAFVQTKVMANFDDYVFYMAQADEAFQGMVVLAKYEGESSVPQFFWFKDGVKGERV